MENLKVGGVLGGTAPKHYGPMDAPAVAPCETLDGIVTRLSDRITELTAAAERLKNLNARLQGGRPEDGSGGQAGRAEPQALVYRFAEKHIALEGICSLIHTEITRLESAI